MPSENVADFWYHAMVIEYKSIVICYPQAKAQTQRDLVNALEIMSTEDFEKFLQDLEPQQPDMQTVMFNKCLKFLELIIRKYIKFAKAVPGFKMLPIDDQVALVKGEAFAWWIVSIYDVAVN